MSDLSIFEEYPKLSFNELQQLNEHDVPQSVNCTEAIQICRGSLEAGDVQYNEVQKLWHKKLLKAYNVLEFAKEQWIEILSFLDELYKQMLEHIGEDVKLLVSLNAWLIDCGLFMQWFHALASKLNVTCNCIVLGYALETVIGALQTYRRIGNITNGGKNDKIIIVHSLVLRILEENMENWHVENSNEFAYLTEVITSLCVVGEDSTSVSLKAIIETWKIVAKLTAFCVKHSNIEGVKPSAERPWLMRPMLFLINEIIRNMSLIYKEETLKQAASQLENFFRVTNFYLKLLQRLCNELMHEKLPIFKEYLQALQLSKSIPKFIAGSTDISFFLEKYVCSGLRTILSIIYKNRQLTAYLLAQETKKNELWFSIVQDYLAAIVVDQDLQFIENHLDDFVTIFRDLWKAETNFIDASRYSRIIELFAALSVIAPNAKLQRLLLRLLIRSSVPIAYACSDVLRTAMSVSHVQKAELKHNLSGLRRLYDKFSFNTCNRKSLIVVHLLRHCYQLCLSNSVGFRDILWEQSKEQEQSITNLRLLSDLGTADNFLSSSQLQNELSADMLDVKAYYRLLAVLQMFGSSCTRRPPEQLLCDKLYTYTRKITELPLNSAQHFARFLRAYLNMITQHIASIDSAYCQKLLQLILQRHKPFFHLAIVPCIRLISAWQLQYKSHSINVSLDRFIVNASKQYPQVATYLALYSPAQQSQQFSLQVEYLHLYKLPNNELKQQHSCPDVPPVKRARLCSISMSERKSLLNELLEGSMKLKSSTTQLDKHDRLALNSIMENLKCLLER